VIPFIPLILKGAKMNSWNIARTNKLAYMKNYFVMGINTVKMDLMKMRIFANVVQGNVFNLSASIQTNVPF
jgi:hypothetical protein